MATLVLCPSRGRPLAAASVLDSFQSTRRDPYSRLVFVVDDDDPTRTQYPPGRYQLVVPASGSMGGALRHAIADAALLRGATSVGVIGDDCRFRTTGWDLAIDGWLTANVGIAWPDDGWDHPWPSESKASHWWLSRAIVDEMGLCHPEQRHLWMDDYWATLAHAAGCGRYFGDILVEHLHPMAGKAERDETYDRHRPHIAHDRAFWARWQRQGRREDVARLCRILGKTERRRVLADWHHPALWEALSIVFEDRFGWELYSPVGAEWKQHGWLLQGATPGWTADDYLCPTDAVMHGDYGQQGYWTVREPEYPRYRKMVTVEQFEAQRWDVIIASVAVHQRPFWRLARSKGATYVHHIGDARRRHDRSTRGAIVLASARHPAARVRHHQEFDRQVFSCSPPTDPQAVTSLMLRLDSTSGPYRWLSEAAGVRWSAVECEAMRGPGYLAPMSAVADRLREAGWLWHDKRIGDGYGHVLFTAAAMGRPLIGHASHYRGLLGERLWEDGVTCLSLDDRTPDEALRLFREIAADPDRHAAMSAAIRERFEEMVDFDADAERIREALDR